VSHDPSHPSAHHYTNAEEKYLKAVYKFSETEESVSTNTIAQELHTSPASVTDMIKKLSEKALVQYRPYHGVTLTDEGKAIALQTIRKHRLWEVFLVEKLNFSWDEVHETAEQLEHIHSDKLIEKLDEFLGYPRFDPHGDPIPDADGNIYPKKAVPLLSIPQAEECELASVLSQTSEFLRYLDRLHLNIGQRITVLEHIPFENSRVVRIHDSEVMISGSVAQNLLVVRV